MSAESGPSRLGNEKVYKATTDMLKQCVALDDAPTEESFQEMTVGIGLIAGKMYKSLKDVSFSC